MPIETLAPKNVDVKLPKLKKIGDNLEQKKTELPKLKKVH